MDELIGFLNVLMGKFKGNWKLESIYPFIFRGYDGENTIGIEIMSMQSGMADILIWQTRVDNPIRIFFHDTVMGANVFDSIEVVLNKELKEETKN